MAESQTPKFQVKSDAWKDLPQMSTEEYPGTKGFIGDAYSNPEGSPMCAGFFELQPTDAPLDYYYAYDEMKVVLEGEFTLENKDTGQIVKAGPKDVIFFPKGSRILFTTPSGALAYYVGYRDADML